MPLYKRLKEADVVCLNYSPEMMPPLCEMDNMMFKLMYGRLTRHGSMCDYCVVGDAENDK